MEESLLSSSLGEYFIKDYYQYSSLPRLNHKTVLFLREAETVIKYFLDDFGIVIVHGGYGSGKTRFCHFISQVLSLQTAIGILAPTDVGEGYNRKRKSDALDEVFNEIELSAEEDETEEEEEEKKGPKFICKLDGISARTLHLVLANFGKECAVKFIEENGWLPIYLDFSVLEGYEGNVSIDILGYLILHYHSKASLREFLENNPIAQESTFQAVALEVLQHFKKRKLAILVDNVDYLEVFHLRSFLSSLISFQHLFPNIKFMLTSSRLDYERSTDIKTIFLPSLNEAHFTSIVKEELIRNYANKFRHYFSQERRLSMGDYEATKAFKSFLFALTGGNPRAIASVRRILFDTQKRNYFFSQFLSACSDEFVKGSSSVKRISDVAFLLALYGRPFPLAQVLYSENGKDMTAHAAMVEGGAFVLPEQELNYAYLPPIAILSLTLPTKVSSKVDILPFDKESGPVMTHDAITVLAPEDISHITLDSMLAKNNGEIQAESATGQRQSQRGRSLYDAVVGNPNPQEVLQALRAVGNKELLVFYNPLSIARETSGTKKASSTLTIASDPSFPSASPHLEVILDNPTLVRSFEHLLLMDGKISPKLFEVANFYCEQILRSVRMELTKKLNHGILPNFEEMTLSDLYREDNISTTSKPGDLPNLPWASENLLSLTFDFTAPLREVESSPIEYVPVPEAEKSGVTRKRRDLGHQSVPTLADCLARPEDYENTFYFMHDSNEGFDMATLMRSNDHSQKWIIVLEQEKFTFVNPHQSGKEISSTWISCLRTLRSKGWNEDNIVLLFKTNREKVQFRGETVKGRKNVILLCRESLGRYYGQTLTNLLYLNSVTG